ncbi:MAG TPA: efflux RND transporter periplasmic adaptor subunit [Caulobacteraceae bacterium]|nr:efflux RND transporter periplasmic adaptor subunit [Caulobacteraceae bacterium]
MSQTIQPIPGTAPSPRRRTWRTLVGIVLVVAAAVGVGLLLTKCAAGNQPTGPFGRGGRPTVTVGVAQAALGDVPITVTALGTVTPEATVSVVSRVTGQLNAVRFTEGQMVRKGDVLAQVDPAPFQAALNQAEGQLARDQALLADAELDLKRYDTLLAENSISGQTRDTQAALVKQDLGLVAADKGQVATARLNLVWSRIVAPVAGRVGLRQIDAGNQVSANSTTPIAVVTQIDPIDVIFAVPEDAIPAIVKHPGYGAGLPVTATDRTGGATLATGSLATIDNVVDTTTGTVKGKARFGNPSGALFPNQFVNVSVLVDTLKSQVLVPTTAVRHGPQGDFVWLLQSDKTVQSQPVKVGPGTGETTSIVSGLKAGDTVITEGGDRLRDGASVTLPRGANAPAEGAPGARRHRSGGQGGARGGGGGGGGGGFGG